jgi:hypothetical protein
MVVVIWFARRHIRKRTDAADNSGADRRELESIAT